MLPAHENGHRIIVSSGDDFLCWRCGRRFEVRQIRGVAGQGGAGADSLGAQLQCLLGPAHISLRDDVGVLPGKRYYAVVVARWPDGTTLRPVRHQGDGYVYGTDQFREVLNYTTIAGKAPDSMIKEESRKAEEVYPAKWQQWSSKTAEQKASLTIRAEGSE